MVEEKLKTNENYNVVDVTLRIVLVDNEEPMLSKLSIQPMLKEIFDKSEIISIKDIEQKCFNIPYIYNNGYRIEFVYECNGKYFRKDGDKTVLKEFVPFEYERKLFVTFESSMYKLFENNSDNHKHLLSELNENNVWGTLASSPQKFYYHDLPKSLPLTGENK